MLLDRARTLALRTVFMVVLRTLPSMPTLSVNRAATASSDASYTNTKSCAPMVMYIDWKRPPISSSTALAVSRRRGDSRTAVIPRSV